MLRQEKCFERIWPSNRAMAKWPDPRNGAKKYALPGSGRSFDEHAGAWRNFKFSDRYQRRPTWAIQLDLIELQIRSWTIPHLDTDLGALILMRAIDGRAKSRQTVRGRLPTGESNIGIHEPAQRVPHVSKC